MSRYRKDCTDLLMLHRQQGQALVEAVIVLSVLTVLVGAVLGTLQMQHDWHHDVLDAHHMAQRIAAGHVDVSTAMVTEDTMRLSLQHQKSMVRQKNIALKSSQLDAKRLVKRYAVQKEPAHLAEYGALVFAQSLAALVGGSMEWVRVQTTSKFGNHAWELQGQGAVSDTYQTIERIERSESLWRQASRQSQQLVKKLAAPTQTIDAPWGRVNVSTDWLSNWADVAKLETRTTNLMNRMQLKNIVFAGQR